MEITVTRIENLGDFDSDNRFTTWPSIEEFFEEYERVSIEDGWPEDNYRVKALILSAMGVAEGRGSGYVNSTFEIEADNNVYYKIEIKTS